MTKAVKKGTTKKPYTLQLEKQARELEFYKRIPVMHDAQTTMKKFFSDGGVVHEVENKVIIDRNILSNLFADVQVLKLRAASDEETKKGFDSMKEDADGIAIFLREEFAREINLGYHANRTLASIVTGYLQDYLKLRAGEAR